LSKNIERLGTDDDVIDRMFDSNIGSLEAPNLKLMYLVGPISSEAGLKWCPSPEIQVIKEHKLKNMTSHFFNS